jgi:hypothetical protein
MEGSADPGRTFETLSGTVTLADLRKRCRLLEPGIVYVRQLPKGNVDTLAALMDTARELGEPFSTYALVNDLTDTAERPRGAYYEAIMTAATSIGIHWASVWPSHPFTRVVVRFMLARLKRYRASKVTWSFHENLEAATAACRAALKEAAAR